MGYPSVQVIERHTTARGELQLQRRDEHYEVISNGTFLMATYNGASERLLIRVALEMAARPKRVLIGGLGVGHSLAEALQDSRVEQVTVLEIERKIIAWHDEYFTPFTGSLLNDRRAQVICADLLDHLSEFTATSARYDAICLDIDNGPDWTVTEKNRVLYEDSSLQKLRQMLAPGGAIAFWSASKAPQFADRLQRYFHEVKEYCVPATTGEPDVVYVAREHAEGSMHA